MSFQLGWNQPSGEFLERFIPRKGRRQVELDTRGTPSARGESSCFVGHHVALKEPTSSFVPSA